jgi:hypothetical protein
MRRAIVSPPFLIYAKMPLTRATPSIEKIAVAAYHLWYAT